MTTQTIIEQFHPARKFLLLIGLFVLCLGLAAITQVLIMIPFVGVEFLNDLGRLNDYSNPDVIMGMKAAQGISAVITFILPALLFAWLSSRKKLGYLKMNMNFSAATAFAILGLVITAMPVINWLGELNSHLVLPDFLKGIEDWMKSSEESLKKLTEAILQMNNIGDLIVNLIVVALLAAIGEELLFRGAMQNILVEWLRNKHVAIWVTAIIFSAMHAQFYGFIPRMLMGVVLGYIYVWSGSLWMSILFHFLNNGLIVLITYLIGKGIIPAATENVGAEETPFYYVAVCTVLSIGLMYAIYKQRTQEENLSV